MKKHMRIATMLLATLGAASVTCLAQDSAPPSNDINPAVLAVNGDTIYAAEISMVMQNIVAQLGGRDKVEDQQQVVQMATQRVVEQKLLAQEARRYGIQANELRVAQMMQAVEQQAGGREALEASLETRGSNIERLTAMFTEMDLARSLIEKQISPTISVSDEEVTAFYADNPELFLADEQVHARHIVFAVAQDADAQTVTDGRAKAEAARQRAIAGEDFTELARELSEGPSAPNGGDLGFFSREQMEPTFAAAAFDLEVGGISPVVRTKFGLHVIKVVDKRPAGKLPFDEVSEHVRSNLGQQKTGETVRELLKSLAEKATVTQLMAGSEQAPGAPATGQQQPQ
jgi:peptidyl-prolyl cis-trans isomerase C